MYLKLHTIIRIFWKHRRIFCNILYKLDLWRSWLGIIVQINIKFLTLRPLHTYQDGKMMILAYSGPSQLSSSGELFWTACKSSLMYVIFVERSQGYSFPPQPTERASSSLRRNRVLTIIRKMLEKWYASTLSLIGSQDIATWWRMTWLMN